MSGSSNVLVVRAPDALRAKTWVGASFERLRDAAWRLWRAYWDYQARRATVMLLQALDDRMLADIGFRRNEIESAVHGSPSDRTRSYHADWRLHVRS